MKRIFIALPVVAEPEFLFAYHDLQNQLENELIKWVDENHLHLTLKFLGETDEKVVEIVKSNLPAVCSRFVTSEIVLKGFGYFGSKRQPTVVFSGIENQENLRQIAAAIDQFTKELGFEPESRSYKAHLTIGRIKYLKDIERFFQAIGLYRNSYFQKVKVQNIILYESILTREGPVYKSLQSIILKNSEL